MKNFVWLCVIFIVSDQNVFTDGNVVDIPGSIATLTTMVQNLQTQLTSMQTAMALGFAQQCSSTSKNQAAGPPTSCEDLLTSGTNTSGVYVIYPQSSPNGMTVYCDMEDGGGWLVIQRRSDGKEDFFRSWNDYEAGFGNMTDEFYLGNSKIHEITSSGKYELMVVLSDFQGQTKKEHYDVFSVGNATTYYRLHVEGASGDAGDSLIFNHEGQAFSTADADHDSAQSVNCAQKHHGGYWYSNCFKSNINGQWGVADQTGIVWGTFKNWQMYALKSTVMKIRLAKSAA